MSNYPFHEIETKWQKYWDEHKTFKATEDPSVPEEKRQYICHFGSISLNGYDIL